MKIKKFIWNLKEILGPEGMNLEKSPHVLPGMVKKPKAAVRMILGLKRDT